MNNLTDQGLIDELKRRFKGNQETLNEQKRLMGQLEQVNQKLLESEHVKSQFLSNIRNEINNPLSSILGLSKTILRGVLDNDNDKLHGSARLIHQEAFTLDFQLKNIFIAAEIEAGKAMPYVLAVDVVQIMEDLILSFDHLVQKKSHRVTLSNSIEGDSRFKTDPEKLDLIVSNLLANAIEYSPENSSITIALAKTESGNLEIKIEDDGIGIDKENLASIFDRFKQIEEGSTKSHGGHGLGLTITKALTDILGGGIEVESQAGKGAAFIVSIKEGETIGHFDEHSTGANEVIFEEGDEIF